MRSNGIQPLGVDSVFRLDPRVLALMAVQAELICLGKDGKQKQRLRGQRDALLQSLGDWQREQLRCISLSLETLVERAQRDRAPITGTASPAALCGLRELGDDGLAAAAS